MIIIEYQLLCVPMKPQIHNHQYPLRKDLDLSSTCHVTANEAMPNCLSGDSQMDVDNYALEDSDEFSFAPVEINVTDDDDLPCFTGTALSQRSRDGIEKLDHEMAADIGNSHRGVRSVKPATMTLDDLLAEKKQKELQDSETLKMDSSDYYYYYYYYKICIAQKFKRARVRGAGVARWGT